MNATRAIVLLIGVAILSGIVILSHRPETGSLSSPTVSDAPVQETSSVAAPLSGKTPDVLKPRASLARASAAKAFRSESRSGYAWILRQFGMSEADLDRLASAGGFVALVKELTIKADQGNRSATESLGWLAQRCVALRDEDQLNSYRQKQLLDARVLPPPDAEWFSSIVNQDIDEQKQRIADCTSIDQDHVHTLLEALSAQGDGASTFLLAQAADNISDINRLSRLAAIQGFPEGELEWALDLIHPDGKGFYTPQPGDPSALDFLQRAASVLPSALASLALCEYSGCTGEPPDPNRALTDARAAAQQGDPDALLSLAKIVPPSLISPTETQAWKLFEQSLEQRGCHVGSIDVYWMKSMAALSNNATSEARALASQTWQLYGAQAMQQLGC